MKLCRGNSEVQKFVDSRFQFWELTAQSTYNTLPVSKIILCITIIITTATTTTTTTTIIIIIIIIWNSVGKYLGSNIFMNQGSVWRGFIHNLLYPYTNKAILYPSNNDVHHMNDIFNTPDKEVKTYLSVYCKEFKDEEDLGFCHI
jgi:hypothetical protein